MPMPANAVEANHLSAKCCASGSEFCNEHVRDGHNKRLLVTERLLTFVIIRLFERICALAPAGDIGIII